MSVSRAEEMAKRCLAPLPRRLAHVASVANKARLVCTALHQQPDLLISAAWLHDIGYAPTAVSTGFHPVDGARFLRARGVEPEVVNLVAHHSHAVIEAQLRGLEEELESEFPLDRSLPHDLLCYCDMTTGPDGQSVSLQERLSEIRARYGPSDLVTRFVERAEGELFAAVRRVEEHLTATQSR